MSVKFKINKLGPITDSEFEFKPFMIFSGDSSMGKSYSAFLTYYLINAITTIKFEDFTKEKLMINDFAERINNHEIVEINISIKDLTRKLNYNASKFIGYLIGDDSFNLDVEINLNLSDFIIKVKLEDLEDTHLAISKQLTITIDDRSYTLPYSFIDKYTVVAGVSISTHILDKIFNKNPRYNSIFLPPSRAALIGANYSTMTNVTTSAGMYKEFINDMEQIMAPVPESFYPDKNIISLFEEILGGKIINDKGSLFYDFNKEKIPITAAASSIRELAPLFLLLNKTKPENFSVLFEEPEAHIHPTLQIKIADMLCKLVNEGAYFQVTTHSDYFLNQINNSINLFNLKSKLKDGFKDFCKENNLDENKILDPKKLGAYYFQRREDGSVEIKTQNVEEGVPFETFEKSVDTIMRDSAIIENQLEELLD